MVISKHVWINYNLYILRVANSLDQDQALHISYMSSQHPWPHVKGNTMLVFITVSFCFCFDCGLTSR